MPFVSASTACTRLAVLRAVADRPHSTADDIDKVVRAEIGAVSRQAVSDVLGALTDKGRRIQRRTGRLTTIHGL